MKKIIATMVLAAGVVLAVPTAANAATCGSYGLTQSANTAAPGAVVSVTACFGEATGTPVTTSFTGAGATDLFNVTPAVSSASTLGATGAVTFQVRIPASATNGSVYNVSASTAASTYSGAITVVAPAAAPGGSGLASTGIDFAPIALVGGGLLVIGGIAAASAVARRRAAV